MIVRESIRKGFTHLKPKSKEEMSAAAAEMHKKLKNSTDIYELLHAMKTYDPDQEYLRRLIEVHPNYFKNNELSNWKLNDESKEALRKHISSKDSVVTLVKASDVLKDKSYMQMAMDKLISGKPTMKSQNKLSKELMDTCFNYWKELGIEFNSVMDVEFLKNAGLDTNTRVEKAESFVATETYLASDGNGNIFCMLQGHAIKKDGRISAMVYNLTSIKILCW